MVECEYTNLQIEEHIDEQSPRIKEAYETRNYSHNYRRTD